MLNKYIFILNLSAGISKSISGVIILCVKKPGIYASAKYS